MFIGKCSSSKLKKWLNVFESEITKSGIPKTPIAGNLQVCISYRFPHLKSCPKYLTNKPVWKTTRPDLDNLEKAVLDSLVRLRVIEDDSQVVSKMTQKLYSPEPGIMIMINQLRDLQDHPSYIA